jgi:hypothetical protein
MSANNDDRLFTLRLLETPPGREVFQTFIYTLSNTQDVGLAVLRAQQVAENNGTWIPIQILSVIDLLRFIGPGILEWLRRSSR